jgi:hypothetical protein
VAVEPKMERKEISTTAAGFDFAIEFRQLLAQRRPCDLPQHSSAKGGEADEQRTCSDLPSLTHLRPAGSRAKSSGFQGQADVQRTCSDFPCLTQRRC